MSFATRSVRIVECDACTESIQLPDNTADWEHHLYINGWAQLGSADEGPHAGPDCVRTAIRQYSDGGFK